MRLQSFLSGAGACSRRKAMALIQEGRIKVNGHSVREPSFDVVPSRDRVELDDRPLVLARKQYVMMNKARAVVTTTSDPFAKRTVLDLLPASLHHLRPVGRLDQDTTGLLFLTNDGDLAFRLSHPSFEAEKLYGVVLDRDLSAVDLKKLERGMILDGKKTAPCRIERRSSGRFEITLHEGRNRQIRRMMALAGYRVLELTRLRQAGLSLGQLKPGHWRFLTRQEVEHLYRRTGLKAAM